MAILRKGMGTKHSTQIVPTDWQFGGWSFSGNVLANRANKYSSITNIDHTKMKQTQPNLVKHCISQSCCNKPLGGAFIFMGFILDGACENSCVSWFVSVTHSWPLPLPHEMKMKHDGTRYAARGSHDMTDISAHSSISLYPHNNAFHGVLR